MKKLLFMLLCCSVFVMGCNNISDDDFDFDENDFNEYEENVNENVNVNVNVNENIGLSALGEATNLANSAKEEFEKEGGDKNKALQLFNEAISKEEMAWMLADRARVKMSLNDVEGAEQDLSKAISMEQRKIYYTWRAEVYGKLGKEDLKQQDLKSAESCQEE